MIVNNIDDLNEKYPNHPKTAYVKKPSRFAKGGKGKSKKGEAKKEGKTKKSTKPKREQKSYTVSKELQAVIGEKEISRPELIKKTWDYIKEHDLQDPKNKRMIVPDAKLAKVFGSKKPVDMMKLAGLLSKHIE